LGAVAVLPAVLRRFRPCEEKKQVKLLREEIGRETHQEM